MTKDSLRQQFPALTNKAYFNYGGQGPLSQVAKDAIFRSYDLIQQRGPFSQGVNDFAIKLQRDLRNTIASELGVTAHTIALTEDVTIGCNIALWGIDWKAGDHILLSDCEHPGIIAAVGELQRRFQLEVSICPLLTTLNEGDPVAIIGDYLQPNTRLLVISHILWNTGQVLPLKEIVEVCQNFSLSHSQRIFVLVDAAQSVGVLPLNLSEIGVDFYAFTGHKWWCGPDGLGALYVSPEALEDLHPTFIGWRGITVNSNGKPTGWKSDATRYEIATSTVSLSAGLKDAIALHHQWGTVEERYQEICRLSGYLWENLGAISGVECLRTSPPESGLVSFQLTNGKSHQELVNNLEKEGVMLRTIHHPNCVRACVHYFTLESEIDQLVDAIGQVISS
jgi:L-cysteine/cystine lyase